MILGQNGPVAFDTRALQGRSVSLKWFHTDAVGKPGDDPADPTVAVTNLAGSAVTVGAPAEAAGHHLCG
jgi:hypothetical protein